MKGDFTRRTFERRNHYGSVLLQQGRVQLDADWNEQVDIWTHLERLTTLDTVGAHGGPLHDAGMAVTDATGAPPAGTTGADLRISAGRYYVDGVLCENEDPVPVAAQPDLAAVPLPAAAGRYVAYLDVWTEHVTAVERPELREVALGGPDTATRGRTIWQLRLASVSSTATCADVAPPWAPAGSASTGRLRARAQAPSESPGPCVIPATAGYRRLENQLYRVEILQDSSAAGGPTYVWSRDNGSVVARLIKITGDTLTIDAPGRDERLGFARGDWVEVTDVDRVHRGEPGFLGRLGDVAGTELPVEQWRIGPPADLGEAAVVRRWDSVDATKVQAGWVDLEDGVEIEFAPGGVFHTGDHWLIPARTANLQGGPVDPDLAGGVQWPRVDGDPVFRSRAGVDHRFAAVALLDLAADGRWTMVSDCRRLFPPLTELIDVEFAGGDGQEAMPGNPLPQPLAVSVSNGTTPVPGARVRFTAQDAGGGLAVPPEIPGAAGEVVAVTDADGIARCRWRLAPDVTRPSQRVTARLLGPGGQPLGAPVLFAASLSIADQVWYDPGGCVGLKGVGTVQDAIDRLAAVRSIAAVGGDGQDGRPGTDLPRPAEVLVRSDCGPVPGARLRFAVDSGAVADEPAGLGAGATTVDIATGPDGIARCFWRLGQNPSVQVLTAALDPGEVPVAQPDRLAFTANLRTERQDRPGLHVVDVFLLVGNRPLANDSILASGDLVEGIAVRLDGVPLGQMVDGKPILTVTVDMPYPFFGAEQQAWGPDVIGTTPLTLAGRVTAKDDLIVWEPTGPIREFLVKRLFALMAQFKRGDRVLCHLTLTGRAVADSTERDRRVINGLTLGLPRPDGGTDMELPSVDDVHGADFILWFHLVASVNRFVVVPTRTGMLRLKTARDALGLALLRAELQANLPPGVQVTPGAPDREAARRMADRAFRDQPDRRLVFIVDERYLGAATVVRESLGAVDVDTELIGTAEPAVEARVRTEAGEPIDGVLTDDDAAGAVAQVVGFGAAIEL